MRGRKGKGRKVGILRRWEAVKQGKKIVTYSCFVAKYEKYNNDCFLEYNVTQGNLTPD